MSVTRLRSIVLPRSGRARFGIPRTRRRVGSRGNVREDLPGTSRTLRLGVTLLRSPRWIRVVFGRKFGTGYGTLRTRDLFRWMLLERRQVYQVRGVPNLPGQWRVRTSGGNVSLRTLSAEETVDERVSFNDLLALRGFGYILGATYRFSTARSPVSRKLLLRRCIEKPCCKNRREIPPRYRRVRAGVPFARV